MHTRPPGRGSHNVAAIVSTPIRIRTIMGVLPARVLGNGAAWRPAVDAKRYQAEEARRSYLQPGVPGGTLMLKRVVAIFEGDAEGSIAIAGTAINAHHSCRNRQTLMGSWLLQSFFSRCTLPRWI